MAHRTFTDARGSSWSVWEVTPTWVERRSGSDRRVLPLEESPDPPVRDQRSGRERRSGTPDGVNRVRVADHLRLGWLAFESRDERRRLGPIPRGWTELSDEDLRVLCGLAIPVTLTGGRLTG